MWALSPTTIDMNNVSSAALFIAVAMKITWYADSYF